MADELELEELPVDELDEEAPDDEKEQDDDDENEVSDNKDPLHGREDLQKILIDLYTKCKGEDRYARTNEVKDVKQAEFYWGGRQYIWWSAQDGRWNQLPTQGSPNYDDNDFDDMPRFEFVTNIYQARGLMVIAAVAGAPPRIKFFPEDADEIRDIETAEARSKEIKLIERWNPVQKQLQKEAYEAYIGGFICWYARYVSNGEKYGIDSVHTITQGSMDVDKTIHCPHCGFSAPADQAEPPVPCPQCGKPLTDENIVDEEPMATLEDGGEIQTPKGRVVIGVYGALDCNRPQSTNEQSQFHYFGIEEEIHYSTLRAAFEDVADKITPGLNSGPDDVFERNARLSVAQNTRNANQTGASASNLNTFIRCWFRPSSFWMLEQGQKKEREELLEIFPRGCRVEFTGSVYCMSEAKSMDDEIVTTHAMPGRGQHRPAVGTSMISPQDQANTLTNIFAETYEYGIPITYRASDTFDPEANEDQRAAPGLEVEVALKPGDRIGDRIQQVRADSVSPDMAAHFQDLMGPQSDQLSGTYPALSGAGANEGAPDTLGQQSMQRDQAMGRMGIFYVPLKQAHADVATIACRCLEANTDGELKIPVMGPSGDFESESVDVSALEGEAEAYPEGDENFPDLWNQQRAVMTQISDSQYGPIILQDPENAEMFAKMSGIPGLKIPGLDARRKQLKEISEMVKGMSNPLASEAMMPQMPEVDPQTDDNKVESATCKWWLNSAKGQRVKKENRPAWEAVKAHMLQHDAAIPPPQEPEKPITRSTSVAMDKMPPEIIAQYMEKTYGIKVDPSAFVQQVALEHAKKTGTAPQQKPAAGMAGQPGPSGAPGNQALGGGGI